MRAFHLVFDPVLTECDLFTESGAVKMTLLNRVLRYRFQELFGASKSERCGTNGCTTRTIARISRSTPELLSLFV
jgi:hypothetical protein